MDPSRDRWRHSTPRAFPALARPRPPVVHWVPWFRFTAGRRRRQARATAARYVRLGRVELPCPLEHRLLRPACIPVPPQTQVMPRRDSNPRRRTRPHLPARAGGLRTLRDVRHLRPLEYAASSPDADLNRAPAVYETAALPDELSGHGSRGRDSNPHLPSVSRPADRASARPAGPRVRRENRGALPVELPRHALPDKDSNLNCLIQNQVCCQLHHQGMAALGARWNCRRSPRT